MHILDCPDGQCPHQAEQARVTELMEKLATYYADSGRELIAVTIRYALKTGILPDEQSYMQMLNDPSRQIRFTQDSVIDTVSHGKLLRADGTEVTLPYRVKAGETLYMSMAGMQSLTPANVIQGNFGPGQPMPRLAIQPIPVQPEPTPDSDFYNRETPNS